MDVLVLIDKLDDTIHNAKQVPLTDTVRVDKEEIYDILDQMRATIPEEIKQARWIVKERQEMLAEAKREAERIIRGAYDLGALGATDEGAEFYRRRGWILFRGTTSAMTPTGVIRTPDEDDCIHLFSTNELSTDYELTCDFRHGELW